ncbi:Fe-S protein assembly co-chaperone HscB [candidate division KSB1 bacterium]
MSRCWSCRSEIDAAFFCDKCGKIQPLSKDTDYFIFFGFNASAVFDSGVLEKKYYELSRKFHPDFFQAASVEEQNISLENSAFLNRAYKTLKDPFLRANYLIERYGPDIRNDRKKSIPKDLLMEVMEVHELLDLSRQEEEPGKRGQPNTELTEAKAVMIRKYELCLSDIRSLLKSWDSVERKTEDQNSIIPEQRKILDKMNTAIAVRQYLETLLQNIEDVLSEEM